ncbi:MAG: CHAP domain-containing protein [Fimbriimonadaceae bacterium]
MRRKRLTLIFVAIAALSVSAWVGLRPRQGATVPLPNEFTVTSSGLSEGQCTWYVVERAKRDNWKIAFDLPYGRHARFWPERVQGVKLVQIPTAGAIMVLGAWPGNEYGHVAYIESVQDLSHFTISHANMTAGQSVSLLNGHEIREADVALTGHSVLFEGSKEDFPLIGFLER